MNAMSRISIERYKNGHLSWVIINFRNFLIRKVTKIIKKWINLHFGQINAMCPATIHTVPPQFSKKLTN